MNRNLNQHQINGRMRKYREAIMHDLSNEGERINNSIIDKISLQTVTIYSVIKF